MSTSRMIIEERSRDIGAFLVGRLLPFRKKRMVGPFIFIDHMGPSEVGPGRYMDVDQHPHTGLSTLTYLFEGEIVHRDSLGTEQRIRPGSVNWMTAGSGVAHTERTPADFRDGQTRTLHGYQIWVALPKADETTAPSFAHVPAEALPRWQAGGLAYTLVAGKGYGKISPVPVYSELFMVEVKAGTAATLDVAGQLSGEVGVVIVSGAVAACGERIEAGHMLVSTEEDACQIELEAGAHVLLFGGRPFEEERHIYWNFVASSKERIEGAKQRWKDWDWPKVPGDETYVPLPG